jgi:hypothetical protein
VNRKKRDLEEELNEFMSVWDKKKVASLLKDMIPFFELFHIDEGAEEEFEEYEGEVYEAQVRILRTVYLLSRLAHTHAGDLCLMNARFKNLWVRMEKESLNMNNNVTVEKK